MPFPKDPTEPFAVAKYNFPIFKNSSWDTIHSCLYVWLFFLLSLKSSHSTGFPLTLNALTSNLNYTRINTWQTGSPGPRLVAFQVQSHCQLSSYHCGTLAALFTKPESTGRVLCRWECTCACVHAHRWRPDVGAMCSQSLLPRDFKTWSPREPVAHQFSYTS